MKKQRAGRAGLIARFAADVGGQVAVTFGVCLVMLVTAIGGGLDLAHAFVARQQLSHAASLTCQYSTRPPVMSIAYQGGNAVNTYIADVNSYSRVFLSSEKFTLTQTNAAPFAYTRGVSSTVNYNASMPTNFLRIVGLNAIPVGVTINCNANETQVSETQPSILFTESFENSYCNGTCYSWIKPDSSVGALATPLNTFPPKAGYIGASNTEWSIMGHCVEIDAINQIVSTEPDGTHNAELDCDNGLGSSSDTGNSSISNKNYYAAGTYELRYNYVSRIDYPYYDPTYICGSSAADLAWANDTFVFIEPYYEQGYGARTNQINVYFDADNNGSPGVHTTIDGSQQLAGVNLIDMCVYSPKWVQRSVKITVTTPGYYWLSFAADGLSDSKGGQLDNIQMCRNSCSNSVTDNFPSTWTSGKTLFEDTFESPTYSQDPYTSSAHAKGGNLANSYGTSGTSGYGWPSQPSVGWSVAPYNEVNYWMQGATQGSQYISLQGWNGFSNASDPINRSISRSFLLDPGYYSVSYNYVSFTDFSYDFVVTNGYYPVSTAYPTFAPSYNAYGQKRGRNYPDTTSGTLYTQYLSTNFMNVYMSHGQLVSTPIINSTLGGAPTYNNPDGTVTSTPTVPLDNGSNFTTYNASAVNPVIQICWYSSGYVWTRQVVNVKITKPGWYWLTFSAQGDPLTGTGAGANIDDITFTALNSPYGSAPSGYATIPSPGPTPGSTTSYTGFSIVADKFAP